MIDSTLFETVVQWLSHRRLMKFLRNKKDWQTIVRFRGCSFFAGGNNKIEAALLRGERYYDGNNFTAISHIVRPGSVCFDIGANIGVYSSVLARISGDSGNVHSFEPVDHIRSKLIANARLNGYGEIHVNQFALGSSAGTLEMHQIREGVFRAGTSTFVETENIHDVGDENFVTKEVEIRTLDQYVSDAGLERVDFLKIDVEGFELEVLKGAETVLSRYRPAIIFEYEEGRHKPFADTFRKLLAANGYRSWEFTSFRDTLALSPFDFDRQPIHRNILSWHSETGVTS